jgi:hypothetical protein
MQYSFGGLSINNTYRLPIAASIFLLVASVYAAEPEKAYGQVNRYWVALLPEAVSNATGFVGFKYSDDFKEMIYTVNVHDTDNITGVYLYLSNDTKGTTPVLDLMKKPRESNREDDRWLNTTKDGKLSGTINLTGITKDDLTGALDGSSIEYLLKLMRQGMLYVTVETNNNPNGELRGESFVGMDDVFHDASEFNW